MIVVIPCGAKKLSHAAAAKDLYQGSLFQACLGAARVLVPDGRIRVLSGRHGLVQLDQVLEPYEQRIDQPGAISPGAVRAQAEAQGLMGESVVILAPSAYARVASAVWPSAVQPLAGCRGIGEINGRLKRIRLGQMIVGCRAT